MRSARSTRFLKRHLRGAGGKKMRKVVGLTSRAGAEPIEQPGPGVSPVLLGLVRGNVQRRRDLGPVAPAEIPQLDHLGGKRVLGCEGAQSLFQGEQVVVRRENGEIQSV